VRCYAADEAEATALADRALALVSEPLVLEPMVRTWNDELRRYVDPSAFDVDPDKRWIRSELDPHEIRWRVRLTLASKHDVRRLRTRLEALERPVIRLRERTIDFGARDVEDALALADRAGAIDDVVTARATEIRSRFRRWEIRQRLLGNYAMDPAGSGFWGFGWSDFTTSGGGDGSGGDGGGGHGGGHGG